MKNRDLSPREKDVVEQLCLGITNVQIANALHLSEKTVKNFIRIIMVKFGLDNRVDIVVWAYENKIVTPKYLETLTQDILKFDRIRKIIEE